MSDSSEEDTDFISYSKREEWNDVKPLDEPEGKEHCAILYTPQYQEIKSYFGAIMISGERSERVLQLIGDVLKHNPADYTAWQVRRECVLALNRSWTDELDYVDALAVKNPKNYQLWHHRRASQSHVNDWQREIAFINKALGNDAKNYHAWAQRQWVLQTYEESISQEDAFTKSLIEDDVRNNSAWNQRAFLLKVTKSTESEEKVRKEVEYTFENIRRSPNNQSPWSYLRHLLETLRELGASVDEEVKKVRSMSESLPACMHAPSLLVDILSDETEQRTLLQQLADKDQLHKKYWHYRLSQLGAPVKPQ